MILACFCIPHVSMYVGGVVTEETDKQPSWSLKSQECLTNPIMIVSLSLSLLCLLICPPLRKYPFFTLILTWTVKKAETENWGVLRGVNIWAQSPGGMRRSELYNFNMSIMIQNEWWKSRDNLWWRWASLKYSPSMPILILFLFYRYKDTDIHTHLLT